MTVWISLKSFMDRIEAVETSSFCSDPEFCVRFVRVFADDHDIIITQRRVVIGETSEVSEPLRHSVVFVQANVASDPQNPPAVLVNGPDACWA